MISTFKRICFLLLFLMFHVIGGYSQWFSEKVNHNIIATYGGEFKAFDINNDGFMDIVQSGNGELQSYFRIYLNNRNFTFSPFNPLNVSLNNAQSCWNDIDNNGTIDFVVCGTDETNASHTYIGLNNGDTTFAFPSYNIEQIAYGVPLLADFNNDGKIDLFLSGKTNNNELITSIYEQNNGNFNKLTQLQLPGLMAEQAFVFDYNYDGLLDIFITGINTQIQKRAYIFKNNGGFKFDVINPGIDAVTTGTALAEDLNNDNWPDIVITGKNQNNQKICKLYTNHQGIFIETAGVFTDSLSSSSICISDINNDGKLDIIFSGTNNASFYKTILYRNIGNNQFVRVDSLDLALTDAAMLGVDLNNDHKNDWVIAGKTYSGLLCKVYENIISALNTSPSIPINIQTSLINHNSVSLHWNKATDLEQGSTGIRYHLYVSQSGIPDYIVSPLALMANGKRLIQLSGAEQFTNKKTLLNLNEGKYFWAVQSIDNNNNASNFSAVDTFVICSPVTIGNDTIICKGDTLHLKIEKGPYTCNWYSSNNGLLASNAFQLNYTPVKTDTIILQCMKDLGCVMYDTMIIRVKQPLPINLPIDTAACKGSRLRLFIEKAFKIAHWFTSLQGFVHNDSTIYWHAVSDTDTIMVITTDTFNCRNRASIVVHPLNLPNYNLGSERYVCQFDSIKLQIPPTFNKVIWSGFDGKERISSFEYKAQVIHNDTLLVTIIDSNGCSSTDTLLIHMHRLPFFSLGNDTAVCLKDTVLFRIPSFKKNIWYSIKNNELAIDTSEFRYMVTSADTLIVQVTDTNNCKNIDSISIVPLPLPLFSLGNDTAICYGQELNWTIGTGWKRVDWYSTNDGLWLSDSWYANKTFITTDTIIARVQNNSGCKNFDTIAVEVYPLPTVFAGLDTAVCYNDSLYRKSYIDYPYIQWYSKSKGWISNDSILRLKVVNNDTIYLSVFDHHNCYNSDTFLLNVLPLPQISLVSDTSVCMGDTLRLSLNNYWKSIQWKSIINYRVYSDSNICIFPVHHNDTILIKVKDLNGCNSKKLIGVNTDRLPIILLNDTAICANQSLTIRLTDSVISKARWILSDNQMVETNQLSYTFCPVQSDKLIVTAYSNKNCKQSDTLFYKVYQLPSVQIGNDTLVCYGSSLQLGKDLKIQSENEIKKIKWEGVDLAQSTLINPVVQLTTDTIFQLTVEDIAGCTSGDSIKIAVNPQSIFTVPDTIEICYGQTFKPSVPIISGSRFNYKFIWYPDSTVNNAYIENPEFFPKISTTYNVITQTWKCKPDTAHIRVIVHPLPIIYHTPDITIGESGKIQLYAEGGVKYRWWPANSINQSDIPDPIASPTVTTTYTVMVTDSFGCTNYDSVTVFVKNQIFIPDLFSPNNDGKNDVFKIYGFGVLNLSLTITDLQNHIIFQSVDLSEIMDKGWNGAYNGTPMPEGQYRWIIRGRFLNGEDIHFNGKNSGLFILIR